MAESYRMAQASEHARKIRRVSMVGSRCHNCFVGDQPGYSIDLGYFIPPILTRASLEEAIQRVTEVREQVNAPLLLEPAPITFVVGDMTIYEWLGELATTTDCGLLLDAGHLVSHQFALGKIENNAARRPRCLTMGSCD